MERIQGILWGILSGASFGLIPLFTLPLMASGLSTDSLLFYRFGVAALAICLIQISRKESFRITIKELRSLILLGLFYMSSALFLLWGYEHMAAGAATTIHFLYPVCTMLVMTLFFGEKLRMATIGAVVLAVVGVAMISAADQQGASISAIGITVVVVSALAYALYIIGLKKLGIGRLSGFGLTFYIVAITSIMFLLKATLLGNGIEPIGGWMNIANITMLAIIPTVISNFALVNAVKRVGSTTTSILGALEPLTAVVVGVFVFNESVSTPSVIGMLMVIGAVTMIVLKMRRN